VEDQNFRLAGKQDTVVLQHPLTGTVEENVQPAHHHPVDTERLADWSDTVDWLNSVVALADNRYLLSLSDTVDWYNLRMALESNKYPVDWLADASQTAHNSLVQLCVKCS
jgi:hypothetical protein